MGSALYAASQPVHTVEISPFWMDSTEVTQKHFKEITGMNPSADQSSTSKPVNYLTWFDAIFYCNARSKITELDTVYSYTAQLGTPGNGSVMAGVEIHYDRNGFRLPTEAEWEYACRGSTETKYYWGDDITEIGSYAWYNINSMGFVHEVGLKTPNKYGLYDMAGNVWEWANDYYSSIYYSYSPPKDPTGPSDGSNKVIRGGSKGSASDYLGSANRPISLPPSSRYNDVGFRTVVRQNSTGFRGGVPDRGTKEIKITSQKGKIIIDITGPGPGVMDIRAYDLKGRLVKVLYKGEMKAGINAIHYGDQLTESIYILNIKGRGINRTDKIILINQ
jgi:formylglycine-generating enzyme required for sulfatase activity